MYRPFRFVVLGFFGIAVSIPIFAKAPPKSGGSGDRAVKAPSFFSQCQYVKDFPGTDYKICSLGAMNYLFDREENRLSEGYHEIIKTEGGRFLAKRGAGEWYLDARGKQMTMPVCDSLKPLPDGEHLLGVKDGQHVGLFDAAGNTINKRACHEIALAADDSHYLCKTGAMIYLLDERGFQVLPMGCHAIELDPTRDRVKCTLGAGRVELRLNGLPSGDQQINLCDSVAPGKSVQFKIADRAFTVTREREKLPRRTSAPLIIDVPKFVGGASGAPDCSFSESSGAASAWKSCCAISISRTEFRCLLPVVTRQNRVETFVDEPSSPRISFAQLDAAVRPRRNAHPTHR